MQMTINISKLLKSDLILKDNFRYCHFISEKSIFTAVYKSQNIQIKCRKTY